MGKKILQTFGQLGAKILSRPVKGGESEICGELTNLVSVRTNQIEAFLVRKTLEISGIGNYGKYVIENVKKM